MKRLPVPMDSLVCGQQIINCESLSIVEFEKVNVEEIIVDYKDLSPDQLCLFDIHQAIQKRHCSLNLANRKTGKITHSYWLKTANQILCLYV